MIINRSGRSVLESDIVERIFSAEVPLSAKAIANALDIDPTSEALLEIRDTCYDSRALVDIDRRKEGAALFFDLKCNYVN